MRRPTTDGAAEPTAVAHSLAVAEKKVDAGEGTMVLRWADDDDEDGLVVGVVEEREAEREGRSEGTARGSLYIHGPPMGRQRSKPEVMTGRGRGREEEGGRTPRSWWRGQRVERTLVSEKGIASHDERGLQCRLYTHSWKINPNGLATVQKLERGSQIWLLMAYCSLVHASPHPLAALTTG